MACEILLHSAAYSPPILLARPTTAMGPQDEYSQQLTCLLSHSIAGNIIPRATNRLKTTLITLTRVPTELWPMPCFILPDFQVIFMIIPTRHLVRPLMLNNNTTHSFLCNHSTLNRTRIGFLTRSWRRLWLRWLRSLCRSRGPRKLEGESEAHLLQLESEDQEMELQRQGPDILRRWHPCESLSNRRPNPSFYHNHRRCLSNEEALLTTTVLNHISINLPYLASHLSIRSNLSRRARLCTPTKLNHNTSHFNPFLSLRFIQLISLLRRLSLQLSVNSFNLLLHPGNDRLHPDRPLATRPITASAVAVAALYLLLPHRLRLQFHRHASSYRSQRTLIDRQHREASWTSLRARVH